MNRKRFIYLTDLVLVPLFLLSAYTGIALHVAGHGADHEIWHRWALLHTIASLLFAGAAILHIKTHWTWYKTLRTKDVRSKSVWVFSFAFATVAATGVLLLLWIEGAGSPTGIFHYKIGLITIVLGALHLLRRIRFLRRG